MITTSIADPEVDFWSGTLSASTVYSLAIIGPDTGGISIPVLIQGVISLQASGLASASGSLFVNSTDNIQELAASYVCSPLQNIGDNMCGAMTVSGGFGISPGVVYTVSMDVSLHADSNYYGNGGQWWTGTAMAYVDPSIYIDPSFANAGAYQIIVSEGVGNPPPTFGDPASTSVPEPGSLAVVGVGLVGLGLLTRRGRHRAALNATA
jgi:hypothetical protein